MAAQMLSQDVEVMLLTENEVRFVVRVLDEPRHSGPSLMLSSQSR
jgi:uncharacterized protein (DUF1778 family)